MPSETPEPTQEELDKSRVVALKIFKFHNAGDADLKTETRWIAAALAAEAAPLREEIERLTKERDEAREAATDWLDEYRKASNRRVEVEAEALAAASRAREEQEKLGALRAALAQTRTSLRWIETANTYGGDNSPIGFAMNEGGRARRTLDEALARYDAIAPPAAESQENQQQLTGKGAK